MSLDDAPGSHVHTSTASSAPICTPGVILLVPYCLHITNKDIQQKATNANPTAVPASLLSLQLTDSRDKQLRATKH